jgi:hypothetical protein
LLFSSPTAAPNAAGEADMRNHRRYLMLAAVTVLVATLAVPTAEAGGGVSVYLGSGGFGVSVGFGDWGVYTQSWSDPYWSIDFNATLAGYGEWVWVNGLGRVWRPWVAASWQPYTYGRWFSTGCGLTWVAYEPWGYVPHHYGSWAYTSFGWVWVPGYSYSCANVVWVGSGTYVGWYARPPWGWSHAQHGFRNGYHQGFRDGYANGYNDGWDDARYATYVDWNHFASDNVSRYAVTHRIASQSRIETRTEAPTRDEIRQRGGTAITETRLSQRTVTVDGREVTIARPEGVAQSIERNAADAVGRSLSEEALERRQPLVRPRSSASSAVAVSSSGPAGVSRDARSPQAGRSTVESSALRNDRTGISSRSTQIGSSNSGSTASRTDARASESTFGSQPERDTSRGTSPRTSYGSGVTAEDRSQSTPSTAPSSRSTASRRVAQQPQPTVTSQRSPLQTERSATESRQPAPVERGVSESRQSQPRDDRSAVAPQKQDSEEKSSKESSPKRRR